MKDNTKSAHANKKLASRRYRRAPEKDKQNSHWKKHTNSWVIHDYISRWSKQEAINELVAEGENGYYHKKYKTLENFLNRCWYKYYNRK